MDLQPVRPNGPLYNGNPQSTAPVRSDPLIGNEALDVFWQHFSAGTFCMKQKVQLWFRLKKRCGGLLAVAAASGGSTPPPPPPQHSCHSHQRLIIPERENQRGFRGNPIPTSSEISSLSSRIAPRSFSLMQNIWLPPSPIKRVKVP